MANRLYQQVHGRASPPGQLPFTDTWFRDRARRMLHASLIWRLHGEFAKRSMNAARLLIDTFECYRAVVSTPLVDITRAAFVPQLVAMKIWREQLCDECRERYLSPLDTLVEICPGCRIYQQSRGRAVRAHPAPSSGHESGSLDGADEMPFVDEAPRG